MLFSLVQELSWRLDEKGRMITVVSDELEKHFVGTNYGSFIGMFLICIICVESESESFHPVRPPKYSKKDREFGYDINLDFESFLNADMEEARKILGTAVLNSVKAIRRKRIGDFDLTKFEEDLRNFLNERGWLLSGADVNMASENLSTTTVSHLEDEERELPAPLSEDTFWSIIEESRAKMGAEIDTERQCEFISVILSTRSEDQIVGFELTLRDLIRTANHFKVMAACKICEDYVGDDNYLYFRAGLVSFGRDIFYATLENPDACAEALILNIEGEDVLYIADNAFKKKFGNDSSKPLPRDLASDYYNYDLEMEEPEGEDWIEEELPHKYPKLWQAAKNNRSYEL